MRNAISAEWTKLLPHKGTWMLVWLYPIAAAVILTISIIVKSMSAPGPAEVMTASGWIDETAFIWYLPQVTFGRYLIGAYFALIIAGEYGWNTWKLVVPHCARWKLLAAKFVTAMALLYLAWFAAAVIAVVMDVAKAAILHQPVPAGVSAAELIRWHAALLGEGVAPLLLTAVYASLAAIVTRSALAAFIIALVLITIDGALGKIVQALSGMGHGWLVPVYKVLPGYHLENFTSWLHEGAGFTLRLADGSSVAFSLSASALVLAAWIVTLGTLTFAAFRRQDIN